MKVLLLFPPFWDTQQPYLALPSLTAFLKTKKIAVSQRDLNIELLDYILSSKYLKKIGEKIKKQKKSIDGEKLEALKKAGVILPQVISRIDGAKNILRDKKDFFNLKLFQESKRLLQQALFIISIPYFPTQLDLFSYFSQYSVGSPKALIKASADRKTNLFLEIYEEIIPSIIQSEKPNLVGISISGEYQIIPGLTLARFIKERFPSIHVTVGGNIFTRLSDTLFKEKEFFSTFFDSVILHEGEKPSLELVKALSRKDNLDAVSNLLYFKNNKIIGTQIEPPLDVNESPTPDFTGFKLNLYFTPFPVLPILASRGCYWDKCAFCDHGYVYQHRYRARDINLLISDVQTLKRRYKTKYFSFADESISPRQYELISSALIKENCDIRWLSEARFEPQLTKNLVRKIYKAGGIIIYFGLESAIPRILNLMEKGINLKTVEQVLKNTTKAGIWDHVFVFFGFPTETKKEALETFQFIFNHKKTIHSVWSGPFSLDRQSPVRLNPKKFKIKKIKGEPFSLSFDYQISQGCSQKEAKKIWKNFVTFIDPKYGKGAWRILNRAELLLYYDRHGDLVKKLKYDEKKDPFSIIYQ